MAKTLKMVFDLGDKKTVTWSLESPKTGLTKAEVEAAMQEAIDRQAIVVQGVSPTGIKSAYIHNVDDEALA